MGRINKSEKLYLVRGLGDVYKGFWYQIIGNYIFDFFCLDEKSEKLEMI